MHARQVRIILDTNVMYAGLYSSRGASYRVLERIANGKIQTVLSTALLFEHETILKRNQKVLGLSDQKVEQVLDYFCLQGRHQKIFFCGVHACPTQRMTMSWSWRWHQAQSSL